VLFPAAAQALLGGAQAGSRPEEGAL